MPCGRKRSFVFEVCENAGFQTTNAHVSHVDDVQGAEADGFQAFHGTQAAMDVTDFGFETAQNEHGFVNGCGRQTDYSLSPSKKRHCPGFHTHEVPAVRKTEHIGMSHEEDSEMMVTENSIPFDQISSYTSNTVSQPGSMMLTPASFPINSFPLDGLNKQLTTKRNESSCAKCLAGQGGHYSHIIDR